MEKVIISNHAELLARIKLLKYEKAFAEEDLKAKFKEYMATLNPVLIMKDALHRLANDKEVRMDFGKVGLNIGTTFIIDRLLGRQRSIKGFLGSLLVEKLSALFISNNGSNILEGLVKFIKPKLSKPGLDTNGQRNENPDNGY